RSTARAWISHHVITVTSRQMLMRTTRNGVIHLRRRRGTATASGGGLGAGVVSAGDSPRLRARRRAVFSLTVGAAGCSTGSGSTFFGGRGFARTTSGTRGRG